MGRRLERSKKRLTEFMQGSRVAGPPDILRPLYMLPYSVQCQRELSYQPFAVVDQTTVIRQRDPSGFLFLR